ncbi:hypothetical protein CSH63_24735 [Micromonospora tulbaghiae]|uniref:Uncharacterized protein n=1 Tax=Micromonospora tulbaghiae TaxID=479978 RepID=A0A386WQX5_9ACTN|nr:hypothetical protein [Micromonospora tulbaghiae]AYF30591.1 hypothetical protein CSH63_24735 [Micromonospora tulbaghiae]
MLTIAAAQEPARGWGGPVAILVAVAAFLLIAGVHYAWQERQALRSPTDEDDTDTGVNAQVSAVSDTDDTDRDTGWWGRIVEHRGRRIRVDELPRDHDVDLDLAEPETAPETLETAVDRMDRQGVQYMDIVRRVMEVYGVSEATAKRRIREVRAVRRGG